MHDLNVMLRFNIEIDIEDSDKAEKFAEELIESFYKEYDGIKNIEIVDWNMCEW